MASASSKPMADRDNRRYNSSSVAPRIWNVARISAPALPADWYESRFVRA
jgi:hypothetical protein